VIGYQFSYLLEYVLIGYTINVISSLWPTG